MSGPARRMHRLTRSSTARTWSRTVCVSVGMRGTVAGKSQQMTPSVVHAVFEVRGKKPQCWEQTYLAGFNDELFTDFYDDLFNFTGKRQPVVMVFHNPSAEVTASALIPGMVRRGFITQSAGDGHLPFILPLRRDGTDPKKPETITITAIGNLYPGTVGELAARVSLPAPNDESSGHETAIRTARVLSATVNQHIELVAREGLGSLAFTRAGQSMNAYRARFLEQDIFIHTDERATKLERAAYYGGRTEVFYRGRIPGDVHRVDVNSMYVSVMESGQFPYKLKTIRTCNLDPDTIARNLARGWGMVAEVTIDSPRGMFPYRDPISGRTSFPHERIRTTLATAELIEASSRELITEVHTMALYYQAAIFKEYAQFTHGHKLAAKQAGDSLGAEFWKLLGNGLYGKWGQQRFPWERVGDCEPDYTACELVGEPDGTAREHRFYGGSEFVKSNEPEESMNSFPAIAACITAAARMKLWHMMEVAGAGNVYYVDTDALFVNDAGLDNLWNHNLIDQDALGMLKYEASAHAVTIFGNKDYRFGNERVTAGLPDSFAVDDEANTAHGWIQPSLATVIQSGDLSHYRQRHITRKLHALDKDTGWQTPRILAAD